MGHRYTCFGLAVESDLELPDLYPDTGSDPGEPDVRIRVTRLEAPPETATLLPQQLWRDGNRCGLDATGVARYEIRDGREILVDPAPGADELSVRLYVLGTAMGAALMQRGNLVLHGNAVRVQDGCLAVLGVSGSGKSTLAAEFQRRGHTVFSDDVVPVSPDGLAAPGYPRMKLWKDALDRLGRDSAGLSRILRGSYDKFEVPLEAHQREPLPLRWVYVLGQHDGDEVVVHHLSGRDAFAMLHQNTYRNDFLQGPAATAAHLDQCATLVRRARVSLVARPAAAPDPEQTAAAILADLDTDPTTHRSQESA